MRAAVIDVGKPLKNLGWYLSGSEPCFGSDLDECVAAVTNALRHEAVALGFEAPLFVPVRRNQGRLTAARDGECEGRINRPFSAGAGAAVLTTALVVVPYVLNSLRKAAPDAVATIDWRPMPARKGSLLLFEAFVTNQGGGGVDRHVGDARAAVDAFLNKVESPEPIGSAISGEEGWFNLLGAAMMRTGWASDPSVLERECLVVKASAARTSRH